MSETERPRRIAEGLKPAAIKELIEIEEANAAPLDLDELRAALVDLTEKCAKKWAAIEAAQTAYQYPSQAFYVFERILNRRQLQADHPDANIT